MYRAGYVPVGADQVSHVELTREVARRFNHIFGRSEKNEQAVFAATKKCIIGWRKIRRTT